MTSPEHPVHPSPDPHSKPTPAPYSPPPAATATMSAPVVPPRGLAISALVVGIVAFLLGLIPVLGAIAGITAIVLGVLVLRAHQSKGMAITGLILGGIATITSITTLAIGAAITSSIPDALPAPVITQSAAAPEEAQAAPTVEATEPVAPEEPAIPAEYASALVKAGTYSEGLNMSKAGIYDQLTSEYGEQFTQEAAQYAIDNIEADWNANALVKAKFYQESMSMSPAAVRDQLTSEYGEKFTAEEADYAIQHLND